MYSESFKRSFLLILGYGLAFGLGYITRITGNPQISFSFYVSEQQINASYSLGLKDLLDLILIGPIFTLLSFILAKRVIDSYSKQEENNQRQLLLYSIYLIAVVLYNYGNMIHVAMNRLNSQVINEYNTTEFYYSVYFLDEVIGHLFITLGFFIILSEIGVIHTLEFSNSVNRENENFHLNRREIFINIIFGIGLGVITADAYLEGQCAYIFLILNLIISVILILIAKFQHSSLKKNAMIQLIIIMTIVYTTFVLIWGLVTGFKPVYPFFYQGSEL